MSHESPDVLDLRAYLALGGASTDWRADLAAALRSDAPLSRLLRNRLADLVENAFGEGPKLELTGHKSARDKFAGVVSRHEWMEVGRWIVSFRASDSSGADANMAAASHFGIGVKKVEAALTYFNKATIWVDQAMKSEAGQTMGREYVEKLYHSITVDPAVKRINEGLIQAMGLSH